MAWILYLWYVLLPILIPSLTHEDRTNHHHQKQVDQKWGLLIASTATSSLSSLQCSACLQSLKFGISRVYLLLRWSRCIIVVVLAVSESEGVNAAGLGWSWWLVVSLVAHKSRYTTARPLAAAGHSPNYNQLSSRIVALLIIYTRQEISTHTYRYLHTARDIYTRPEISTHTAIDKYTRPEISTHGRRYLYTHLLISKNNKRYLNTRI